VVDHSLPCGLRIVALDRLEDRLVLGDVVLEQPGVLADLGSNAVPDGRKRLRLVS